MWATVRRLLPLAILVNVGLLIVERLIDPGTVANLLEVMCGAGVSVWTGYVARERGCGRGQAVWAAWWLGILSIPLNVLETATGLRITVPLNPPPVPPGVSTLVNVADPHTAGLLLGTTLAVVLIVGIVGLVLVTPFAWLGYWAYGDSSDR